MVVYLRVAKFLRGHLRFNQPTLYVYDHFGERRFSLERCQDPIPAPTVIDSIEFLWELGIKIYNIPEGERSRGYIQVGEKRVEMRTTKETPTESYIECLEFLCRGGH